MPLPYRLPFVIGDLVGAAVAATLTITAAAPTVDVQAAISPSPATLTITTAAPVLGTPVVVTPDAASLTVLAAPPRIADALRPTGADLTVTGAAPTVTGPSTEGLPYVLPFVLGGSGPTQAVLQLIAATPTISSGIRPAAAVVTVTRAAPTVTAPLTMTPTSATLTLTPADPLVSPLWIGPTPAELTITAIAPVVTGITVGYRSPTAWSPSRAYPPPVAGAGWWSVRPEPNPAVGAGWWNRPGAQPAGARASLDVTATPTATLQAALRILAPTTITITASATIDGGVPPGFPYTFPYEFVASERFFRPTPAQLVVTGIPPTVLLPKLIVPTGGSLSATAAAPIVSTPVLVHPEAAALTIAGSAATVTNPRLITPAAAALAASASVPTVTIVGSVEIGSIGAGNYAASGSTSWTHVIGANDTAVVVLFCWSRSFGSGAFTTNTRTVRVGSIPCTYLVGYANNNGQPPDAVIEFYYLLNPPTGTQTISVAVSGRSSYNMAKGNSVGLVRAASVVDGGGGAGTETGTALTQSVNSDVGHRVLQAFCHQSATAIGSYSQHSDYTQNTRAGVVFGDAPGAATVTFTATRASGVDWARIAANIQN